MLTPAGPALARPRRAGVLRRGRPARPRDRRAPTLPGGPTWSPGCWPSCRATSTARAPPRPTTSSRGRQLPRRTRLRASTPRGGQHPGQRRRLDGVGAGERPALRQLDAAAARPDAPPTRWCSASTPARSTPATGPVVLEPGATQVIAQWLGWSAFAGKAVHEGRSALSGRMGAQVCSPLVTLLDDPTSPLLPGMSRSTPRARRRAAMPLIEPGVAVGVTHDRASAALAGMTSTGHALPAPNHEGGLPRTWWSTPGDQSLDQLVGRPRARTAGHPVPLHQPRPRR